MGWDAQHRRVFGDPNPSPLFGEVLLADSGPLNPWGFPITFCTVGSQASQHLVPAPFLTKLKAPSYCPASLGYLPSLTGYNRPSSPGQPCKEPDTPLPAGSGRLPPCTLGSPSAFYSFPAGPPAAASTSRVEACLATQATWLFARLESPSPKQSTSVEPRAPWGQQGTEVAGRRLELPSCQTASQPRVGGALTWGLCQSFVVKCSHDGLF